MRYVFLPPYSPHLNPIELAFASMKTLFKRNQDIVTNYWKNEQHVRELLIRTAFSATADKARKWFQHCNYLPKD